MANILQIQQQISAQKERVKGLDNGQLFYEIWAFIPDMSDSYTLYYKGSNKTEKIYDRFCNELDTLLGNTNIAKIRVVLKSNKKNFGDTEIVLKNAYQTSRNLPHPIKAELPFAQNNEQPPQPQQPPNAVDIMGLFGMSMGLDGLGEVTEKYGLAGTMLALQKNQLEKDFERRQKDEKMQQFIAENAVLKANIAEKEREIENLKTEQENLKNTIGDLEDSIEEYEKLNPQRDMVSGIGQQVLQGALLGLVKKTKYAGLLGLDGDDSPLSPDPQSAQPTTDVQITEAGTESELDTFFATLDVQKQAQFIQLIEIFKSDNNMITACLVNILNNENN